MNDLFLSKIATKKAAAEDVIRSCIGKRGLWASTKRYQDQCWTRDFAIAGLDALLEIGRGDVAERHLRELAVRMRADGKTPIMFLDRTVRFLATKAWHSLRDGRLSFLLKAYFSKGGVGDLSPWTLDSELMFAFAAQQYAAMTGRFVAKLESSVALDHAVDQLADANGLIVGADWRDTRPDLHDKRLLSNNCILYRTYRGRVEDDRAAALRSRLNELYWTGTHYRDYPSSDELDTFGNALAILYGVALPEHWPLIIEAMERFNTSRGYVLYNVTLPPKSQLEAHLMARVATDGIIWPFIHGFIILALIKAGQLDRAETEFAKWTALPGFYEWYSPTAPDAGHGSVDQLWSAALYIRVANTLGY